MQFIERIAKKFGRSASEEVVKTVKEEAKSVGVSAVPMIFALGMVVVGVKMFRSSSAGKIGSVMKTAFPTVSHVTSTTNNFFFGKEIGDEVLNRIINIGGERK